MPDAIPNLHDIFGYHVYFWSDEGNPLEPVHIHIVKGKPRKNATKYWVNSDGTLTPKTDKSEIPANDLRRILKTIQPYSKEIIKEWEKHFKVPAHFNDSIKDCIEEFDIDITDNL